MTIAEPATAASASAQAERCPWCDQPITHEKFEEIQARIKEEEQQRSRELSDRLHTEFEKDKAERAAKAKADLERAREEAAAKISQEKAEAAAREEAAREEAKKATEAALAERVTKAEEAKKLAEGQLKVAKAEQEQDFGKRLKKELAEQRDAFEKAKAEAVNGEKAKAFESQQNLRTKLEQVQRQLERKTADELGEGAEIDLFETLRTEFPDDRIKRIGKGVAGADIWHDIWHNDQEFGRIVYDSKNRNQWRSSFVSKLRTDQLAAKADHAILATRVFPSGERQLCIRDGVIVTNPARVVELVRLLREHAIQVQRLRLSNEERKKKMAALYDFLNSERCGQLLDQVGTLTDEMLELEVKEQKAHDRTWKSRGTLIRSVQKVHADFRHEVDQIIERGEAS